MNRQETEFWMEAYVAAVHAGQHLTAREIADMAVKDLRSSGGNTERFTERLVKVREGEKIKPLQYDWDEVEKDFPQVGTSKALTCRKCIYLNHSIFKGTKNQCRLSQLANMVEIDGPACEQFQAAYTSVNRTGVELSEEAKKKAIEHSTLTEQDEFANECIQLGEGNVCGDCEHFKTREDDKPECTQFDRYAPAVFAAMRACEHFKPRNTGVTNYYRCRDCVNFGRLSSEAWICTEEHACDPEDPACDDFKEKE